jgi:predicted ester cyclase
MSEANKALAARMPLEVFAQGRTEVIDEVLAPDFTDHGTVPPGFPPGPDGVKTFVAVVRNAFPDLTITIDHAIAEGDFVALHITASATMKGEFAGMPPSGKHATWEAVHISRFENGKVAEHWVVQDQLGMLQQLGFVPTSPAEPAD